MQIIKVAVYIFSVKFRMFYCPSVIPPGMVGHPVDQHFETQLVCFVYQPLKIFYRTELRIYAYIIGAGIITSEGSQTSQPAYRRNGHEPEHFNAHFPESG